MRRLDYIVLTVFGAAIAFTLPGTGILLSLILGILFARFMMWLADIPFIGNIALIVIALIWVGLPVMGAELITYSPATQTGIVSVLTHNYPVIVSAVLLLGTIASVWLQFTFVKDDSHGGFFSRLFDFFSGLTWRRPGRYSSGRYRREWDFNSPPPPPPVPTYEDLLNEFAGYRASFDRVHVLIDEITSSGAFAAGGFMIMGKISEVMSFIQDHNSYIEDLARRFRAAGSDDEKRSVMSDMEYANRRMNELEQELRMEYMRMQARFAGSRQSYSDNSQQQRRRSDSGTRFTADGEVPNYFNGCETLEDLNKRYKSLAKKYHPDMPGGDTETMAKINQEYDRLKARFK